MKKRIFSIFCVLCLVLTMLPATALATDEVSYLAYSWDGSKLTSEMKSVTDYTLVASTDTAWGAAGETTWYVADGDVSISNRVDVNGSVNLLLKDDCELSPNFIIISAGSTLTIYAQTEGETAGKLVCSNGIGTVGSTLIIHGGTVNATGTIGAGIGGRSSGEQGGTVTIYGGTVTATGYQGAGIGGRSGGGQGGTVTIYGGTVTATGYQGAGIGGGSSSSVDTNVNVIDSSCGNGGTVTIYGGTVNASGTNGAGIGGGSAATGYYAGQQYYVGGGGGTITINGGTVNATGTSGGIGAGPNCGSRDFTNKVTPKGTLKGTSIGLITGTLVPSLNTSSFTGLIKNGGTYTVYGNLSLDTLETPLSISEGENLSINGSLNIPVGKTVTVTNAGTIDCGSGKFVNNGTLYLDNSSTVNGTFGGSGVFLISVDLPDDTNDLTAFPDTFTYTGEDFAGQIFLGTGGTQELGGKTFWETVRTDGWTITYAKDGQSTETVIDAGEYTATFTPPEGETITRTFTVKRAAQTISAPEIQSQSEGAVTLKPVTGVVGKVEYGYSTTNDAASIDNWQESPTFNDMTYGTYYFFAKVTGDSNHEDAVSSTGTVVAFREISSISITSNPTKMLYTPGATLDLTGLKITVTYTDNSTAEVTWTADSGITASIPNGTSLTASHDGQTITITYGGKTAVTDSLLIYDEVPQQIDGVYQIGTVKELIWFAALVNGTLTDGTEQNTAANAVLTADIDLGGRLWAPIASSTIFRSGSFSVNGTTNTSYSGIFDGQGHIISNFKIRTNSDELTSGLFGAVTGTIENLGIVNASFDNGGAYDGRFGALCGLLVKDRFTKTAATIQNCYVVGSSIAATRRIAGTVCGANYGGTIEDCYECGNTVTAHERIGHLVGDNHNDYDYNPMTGIVTNCYSDTKLAGTQGGTVNGGGVKDAEEFASGEVAYLLNGSTSENVIWYQNVDIGTKDNYPVLDSSHGIVYFIEEEPVRYSNDPDATAEPTDISSATVTLSPESFTYNGQSQKPKVTVTLGDKTLTEGTHYTVSYSGDTTNVGEVTVTIKGTGNYTGEATNKPSYTINKATPTLTWSEGSQTLPYTGSPADITAPTVNLVNNETYSGTISYQYKASGESEYTDGLPTDVGTYTVMASIAAQDNYNAATSSELALTIEKAAATGTVTAETGLTYNGQAQNLVTAGNVTGGTMQYSTEQDGTYSTEIPTGTEAKTYTVWYKVVGDANHSDSDPASVNVSIAKLPVELTWSNTDFTYDGSAKCPTATVSNKANDTDEVNVTVSGGQTNASDTAYTATATGLSGSDAANYTLTGGQNITQTFTIAKAPLTVTAVTATGKAYDGNATVAITAVTLDGVILNDDVSVDTNGLTGTVDSADAGTYTTLTLPSTLTLAGAAAGNYTLTLSDEGVKVTNVNDGSGVSISQAESTISIKDTYTLNYTYTGQPLANPTSDQLAITGAGYDDVTFTWYKDSVDQGIKLTSAPKDAGTYYLVASIPESKNTSAASATSDKITISPKEISSPTIELEGGTSFEYTSSEIKPEVLSVKDGDTVIPTSEYTVSYSDNTNVGTATVTIVDAAGGNYTVSGSINFTITKAKATVTEPPTANTLTYTGQAQELVMAGTATGGTMQYSTEENGTYSTDIPTGTNAGDYTVWYKVVGDENHSDTQPVRIEVTIAGVSITDDNVTLSTTEFTYNGQEQKPTVTVTLDDKNLVVGTDYEVSYDPTEVKDAGTYTVTVTGKGSYEGTVQKTFTIQKADPAIGNVTYGGGVLYESTALNSITLNRSNTTVPGTLKLDAGQTLRADISSYKWTFTPDDADNYETVTGTVQLTVQADALTGLSVQTNPDKTEYVYGDFFDKTGLVLEATYESSNTKNISEEEITIVTTGPLTCDMEKVTVSYQGMTCQVSVTVGKATYSGQTTVTDTIWANTASEVQLPQPPDGATFGNPVYSVDSDTVVRVEITGNTLAYEGGSGVTKGQEYKITVPVNGGTNYNDYDITVTLIGTDKKVPTGAPTLSTTTITYGQSLSTITLSGSMQDGAETVTGTFAWADPDKTPNAGSYEARWTFAPDNGDLYAPGSGTVTITVNKATPRGTPKYTAITTSGKTLADAGLTTEGGTFSVPGTVAWELDDTTQVQANTAYTWKFTPDDSDNYNSISGSVTLYTVSSGGGGGGGSSSSNITTETTKNPDGSTTTTVTNKTTGTVTETTTWPDGSKEVIETKKDGTVTTTTTDTAGNQTAVVEKPDGSSQTTVSNKDGSGSVTLVDADGNIISQATLSESAVAAAQEKGEAVTLPMPEVPVTTDRETAPTVTVSLPSGTTAKVEIPVENVTPGTVAILVKADGTEEVIKTSLTTENGVAVTLFDGDTVKIVDNNRDFADVPDNYWGAEAVDFATSRELFAGTGASTFSPDTPMTRGMFVTVLARFEGVDTTTGSTWYEAGQQWAMQNGISDGSNMEQGLTREQLATMLYRYAQSKGYDTTQGGMAIREYADFEQISGYAVEAMTWAVNTGIINGTSSTTISPQGPAARAQVATILMRFIEGMA